MTDRTSPTPDGEPQAAGETWARSWPTSRSRRQAEPVPDDETLGEKVAHVVESAAELGLGAVIAPFTGGETVNIVGSVASMLEAGSIG